MAGANLPAKKYKKTSPTVTRLSFEFTGSGQDYIDIAKALSAVNRKFYRQGVYYYVNSIEVYNNEQGVVDLYTLCDNWVTKNAWNRGFQVFQKMNAMVDSPLTNGIRPKYHDFKVHMDSTHVSQGSASPSLHNRAGAPATVNNDDWVYSKFVSADADADPTQEADDFYVHMLGTHTGSSDNWTSVGLIKSYAESRARPHVTAPITDTNLATDPLLNIFDFSGEEQMNDIIANLEQDNDAPPYDLDNYVGETSTALQHVARVGTEVGLGRVGRASGFCAPFGLICVDASSISTGFRVVLNLAQGTYHGVYAERA
jgi:hypothetical protein